MQWVQNDPVARVVVAATRGSVPREVGASMIVTHDGVVRGTIGGGTLEFEAIDRARDALHSGSERMDRCPLGPALGQCCGGSVTLLTEIWDRARLERISGEVVARPVPRGTDVMPLSVKRLLTGARNGKDTMGPLLLDDWMVEPVSRASRNIWVWGAGHVGKAIVGVIASLPGIQLHWADTSGERFPERVPDGVKTYIATNPADLVSLTSADSEHYVLTYSHALDLEICHRVLGMSFRHLGLIGSETKRARFRSRLAALGHSAAQIDRMVCPIGDPRLGKHPQEIALGVGAEIMARREVGAETMGRHA